MSAVTIVAELPETMLSSASNTTNSGALVICSISCCVAPKQDASHVTRLREVLECALRVFLWQRRSFFWFLQIGRGADVSTAPSDRSGPFFFGPSVVGSKSKQPCFLMRQSRLACGMQQFDEAHSNEATSCRPCSTGCCRLAKATEQEYD